MTDKMDIYSDMEIPFDIAAYLRGRKFSAEAVGLTRAIRLRDKWADTVSTAQRGLDDAERNLASAIVDARTAMDTADHPPANPLRVKARVFTRAVQQ